VLVAGFSSQSPSFGNIQGPTNGRRDHFEQNVHFDNLVNSLSVVARKIGALCRASSAQRNWVKKFDQHRGRVEDKLKVLGHGAVGRSGLRLLNAEIAIELEQMMRISAKESVAPEVRAHLRVQVDEMTRLISKTVKNSKTHRKLKRLSAVKRNVYEHAFTLIYKHCKEHLQAQRLIEAMLVDI
jgi:hypothetical protein